MIDPERGIAAEVLRTFEITTERVDAAIAEFVDSAEGSPKGQIPFTPRAKKVLELSLREALSLGHNYIGPEHILLGLVRETEGVGHQILNRLGAGQDEVRNEVIRHLSRQPMGTPIKTQEKDPPAEVEEEMAEVEEEVAKERLEDEGIEVVPTHPDRPATRDELGRKRLAAVVAERIRRAREEDTEMPVTTWAERMKKTRADNRAGRGIGSFLVHIHAPWGAGKSSLLNFLAADLRNCGSADSTSRLGKAFHAIFRPRAPDRRNLSQWIVVEFSAWKHQRLVPPWWWLLAAVQRTCARELWQINRGRWLWFWVRDIAWWLWNGRVVAVSGLLLVGLAAAAWQLNWLGLPGQKLSVVQTVVLTAISAIGLLTAIAQIIRGAGRWLAVGSAEGAVRYIKRAHDPLKVYRRRFRWLVQAAGRPITVFIDDLDRCRPEYVVELLEGIQTLFVNESVTYVVAADRTWLCESFASTYADFQEAIGDPGRPLGYLFLEKTFQISLEIPPMSDEDQNNYWRLLMEGKNGNERLRKPSRRSAELSKEFIHASTQAEVEQGIRGLIEAGEDREEVRAAAVRRMNAPELQDQQRAQLGEYASLLEKNPRSMKRLMNAYGIERDRLLRDGYLLTRVERGQLTLLTIVRLRWPELAEHFRRFPDDAKYCLREEAVPPEHPYSSLFEDPELRRVFAGTQVETTLNASLLAKFPERPPA